MPRPRNLILSLIALLPTSLLAWGPHPEITKAGVDTLNSDDPLRRELGPELKKLREYCWMADWRGQLRKDGESWFYSDDFLLFPPMPKHLDHLCPMVKATYEPYFRRALQALRTESPLNAARWIGSILHFTEDTGSPPHAAEISGEVHSRMENWVDAKAIHIPGYVPQLLGATEEEAVTGFLKRMDGLIAFSRQRSDRAKPFVLAGDRPSTEPIVLESALETSRVVADLLHTLGVLAEKNPSGGGAIEARITSVASPGLEKMPARIVLLGTNFSTLAGTDGSAVFRNLPAGTYDAVIERAGAKSSRVKVTVSAGQTTPLDVALETDVAPGNLVRNQTGQLIWLSEKQPDRWTPIRRKTDAPHWQGELIPVSVGTKYRFQAKWPAGSETSVVVHLYTTAAYGEPPTEFQALTPANPQLEFTPEGKTAYAQILLYTTDLPAKAIESVALSEVR